MYVELVLKNAAFTFSIIKISKTMITTNFRWNHYKVTFKYLFRNIKHFIN